MRFDRRLALVSAAVGGLVMLAGCNPSSKPVAAPSTKNHGSAPIAVPTTDQSASIAAQLTTSLPTLIADHPATAGNMTPPAGLALPPTPRSTVTVTCHRTGDTQSYGCVGYLTIVSAERVFTNTRRLRIDATDISGEVVGETLLS